MNYEELIDAMASIVCYNSYEEVLKSISDYIKYYAEGMPTSQVLEVFHDILSERIEQDEENQ